MVIIINVNNNPAVRRGECETELIESVYMPITRGTPET